MKAPPSQPPRVRTDDRTGRGYLVHHNRAVRAVPLRGGLQMQIAGRRASSPSVAYKTRCTRRHYRDTNRRGKNMSLMNIHRKT